MNDLKMLIFSLKEKSDELDRLRMDIFTYNPRIAELSAEIEGIREQIDNAKIEYNLSDVELAEFARKMEDNNIE
jgi:uncharacterized coiled-coil DUF342 family protein